MKNRYKKIVLKAESGITFDVSEGIDGELIILALNSSVLEKYKTPPIPEGYEHVEGDWSSGFVIENLFDGSQFVWIPVGMLESNGTLDGNLFNEKFGRRNHNRWEDFGKGQYNEPLKGEFQLQVESVNKYGGFYISRYNISIDEKSGRPQSIKGEKPAICTYDEAMEIAASMEKRKNLTTHLTFGAEYDSVLEWFIESKVKTRRDIAIDSSNWGNYAGTSDSLVRLAGTGSREEWCVNNIYDFAGNVQEWTQERKGAGRVYRGGHYEHDGSMPAVASAARTRGDRKFEYSKTGFRVSLYMK